MKDLLNVGQILGREEMKKLDGGKWFWLWP